MTKSTQTFVALIILVTGGIWLYTSVESQPDPDNNTNNKATSSQSVDTPENWERYENSTYNFSIAHPPETTVQAEGIDEQNHIKFMYLGSPQATGHINDGFTLTVSTYSKEDIDAESLQAFVEQQLEEDREAGEVTQEPAETEFNGRTALEYQVENIGIITVTALETTDTFATISHSSTDPNDEGYERMIADMRSTLTLEEVE